MKTLKLRTLSVIYLSVALLGSRTQAAITVLDYYRLGEADAGAANGGAVTATSADSVGAKPLTRMGSPTYTNAVSAGATLHTGSQLAISFSGSGQSLSNAVITTVTDNFGIEAWARPNLANSAGVIAYNGNTASSGWGFFQNGTLYSGLFGGLSSFGSAPVTAGVWTHLALVRASGTTTLYVNGAAVATDPSIPGVPNGGFGVGQPGQTGGSQTFNGQIDEVRVFTFAAGQFSTNDLLFNASANISPVTMTAALQTDVNGNGRVNPGDTLRYTVVITNNTGSTLSNAVFNALAISNASLVGGSLKASPLARGDAPATNSAPGGAFHGALNTTLNIPAVSGLLSNDFLGLPAAQITSFGGGSFPGTVTTTAAGATANAAGIGALTVNADGSVTFIPNATFNGLATFQYRLANSAGTNDTTATLAIGIRPGPTDDSFNVTGNTLLDTSLIPAAVLSNDSGSGIGISGNTAPANGSVTLLTNGIFRYTPNAGFTGGDSFTYTITNGFGPVTATVNLTVANKVWYIDGASVAGTADGRSSTPFKTILAFNSVNDGVGSHPADNDIILIRDGTYTNGIVLRTGQKLIGDGSSGTLAAAIGFSLAAGSAEAAGVPVSGFSGVDPVITSSGGHGVTLSANNTIRGITVGDTPSGTGFIGASVGTLNISESSKIGTGGAISISGSGALGVSFDTLGSTNATGAAISLVNCSGTFSATTGDIVNPITPAIFINGASGSFTYPGSITKNSAGRIVDIQNRTGGSVTLSGDFSQNNAVGTGINVATNSSTTVTFSGFNKFLDTFANTAITFAANSGSTVQFINGGFELDTSSGTAISISGGGTFNMSGFANTINSTIGTAFLNSGIGGSATIDINAELAGGGRLIDIQNRTGGTVTLSGDLSNPGTGMLIQNNSGGTITMSGTPKTFSTGTNTAVNLVNNSGTTINFNNGGLGITTTTTGFSATGGAAAINVTGTGNKINSGAATALNVVNTTIGASGLTFQSISSSGGTATGIILDGTGSNGLTVTGTSTAGSGGTIASKTGTDLATTTGIGIYLNNCSKVSLSRMQLNDFQNFAIRGVNVSGFSLNNSVINSTGGNWNGDNSTGGFNEGSVSFANLLGSAGITNTTISGGFADNFRVVNTNGTLNRIIFDGVTIGPNQNGAALDGSQDQGNDGITIESQSSAVINATVQNSVFTSARGDLFQFSNNGSNVVDDLVFTGNHMTNNYVRIATGGGGVSISDNGTGGLTYNIANNTFRDAVGTAVSIVKATGTSSVIGTFTGNAIGVTGVANSGSKEGDGIKLQSTGLGVFKNTLKNNTIKEYNNFGIDMLCGGGASATSGTYEGILSGNNVGPIGSNTSAAQAQGIGLNGGTVPGDTWQIYVALGGVNAGDKNVVSNWTASNGLQDIRLRQRQNSTVHLTALDASSNPTINYAGGATDVAAVQTFFQTYNTTSGNNSASASGTGGGFVGGSPP